jgi:outer membrane receptor protein involved in Fe transport
VGYAPYLYLPAYGLTDLRAGVRTTDDKYTVQLYVDNAMNRYYLIHAADVQDTAVAFTGMPRTYGVKFSVRF